MNVINQHSTAQHTTTFILYQHSTYSFTPSTFLLSVLSPSSPFLFLRTVATLWPPSFSPSQSLMGRSIHSVSATISGASTLCANPVEELFEAPTSRHSTTNIILSTSHALSAQRSSVPRTRTTSTMAWSTATTTIHSAMPQSALDVELRS